MVRPIEKTHRLDVETLREMRTAYSTPEGLAHALGMHVTDVKRVLKGEGLRPVDHAKLVERWQVVDPRVVQTIVKILHDQVHDDCGTMAEISFVEVDELRHFFNALFPHLEVE